jgi:hypothetical protein
MSQTVSGIFTAPELPDHRSKGASHCITDGDVKAQMVRLHSTESAITRPLKAIPDNTLQRRTGYYQWMERQPALAS